MGEVAVLSSRTRSSLVGMVARLWAEGWPAELARCLTQRMRTTHPSQVGWQTEKGRSQWVEEQQDWMNLWHKMSKKGEGARSV